MALGGYDKGVEGGRRQAPSCAPWHVMQHAAPLDPAADYWDYVKYRAFHRFFSSMSSIFATQVGWGGVGGWVGGWGSSQYVGGSFITHVSEWRLGQASKRGSIVTQASVAAAGARRIVLEGRCSRLARGTCQGHAPAADTAPPVTRPWPPVLCRSRCCRRWGWAPSAACPPQPPSTGC